MGKTSELSLSRRLAYQLVVQDIGARATERAAYLLLDGLANVLAGTTSTPGGMLVEWLRAQPASDERTAFAMAGCAHALELDDLHRSSVTHLGCVVFPVALVTARRRGAGPGALLTAIVRGYEVMIRVGESVGRAHYRIFHNTATCGPFGAAAAVVSLCGPGEDAYTRAFGSAGTVAGGLWQFNAEGAMSKPLHAAHATRTGVVAADLALLGLTGPERILEGEQGFHAALCPDGEPRAVVAPSREWKLLDTSIKPWPTCRHTHPALDSALRLSRQVDVSRISAVHVRTYPAAVEVCDRPQPVNASQAAFSLQHCVAAALVLGGDGVDRIGEATLASQAVSALAERVTLEVDQGYADAYPRRWQSAVRVTMEDGAELGEEALAARGDPEAALSWEELADKARRMLTRLRWDAPRAKALIAAVERLPGSRDPRHLEPLWEALDERFGAVVERSGAVVEPAPPAPPPAAPEPPPLAVPVEPVAAPAAVPAPAEAAAEDLPLLELASTIEEDPVPEAARLPDPPSNPVSPLEQARARFAAGRTAHADKRFDEAEAAYRESVDTFYRLGETRDDAAATLELARLEHQRGALAASLPLYERALMLYESLDDLRAVAEVCRFVGILARDEKRLDDAEVAFGEAIELFSELADREQQAATLYLASLVAKERGNRATADKLLGDARRIYAGAVPG